MIFGNGLMKIVKQHLKFCFCRLGGMLDSRRLAGMLGSRRPDGMLDLLLLNSTSFN